MIFTNNLIPDKKLQYHVEEHPCPEPPKDTQTLLQPAQRNIDIITT